MEDRALMHALSELVTTVDKMRGRTPPAPPHLQILMIDGRPSSCRGGEQPTEGAGAVPVPQTGRGATAGLPPGSADHGVSSP